MNISNGLANRGLRASLGLSVLAGTLTPLSAQENSGQISGTVTDASGAAIAGAKIKATGATLPLGIEATSGQTGQFEFIQVPTGIYILSVTHPGFATLRQNNVEVKLGSRVTYNPKLSVGTVTETVEVSESTVSLDLSSSRSSTNIVSSEFDRLPKGREFTSLLVMAPGVRSETKSGSAGSGSIQVNGASALENVFVLDGVDATDLNQGQLRSANAIPFEFIGEIQIKTGGYEAEFGGALGGVINVRSKGGSNTFHGEINTQFTSNQLNPRPRGFWQASPASASVSDFFAQKEDKYRTVYPGFNLGGALIKNRLFFFQGIQPTFSRRERNIAYAAPTGARQYTTETIQHFTVSRLDWAASKKLNVSSSYFWSPTRVTGGLPNADPRRAAPTNDQSLIAGYIPNNNFSVSGTYTPASRTVVSVRYGYQYVNSKGNNYNVNGSPFITNNTASASSPIPVPPQFASTAGTANVSSTLFTVKDILAKKVLNVDLNQFVTLFGQQHNFKVGYARSNQFNDIASDYTNGRFTVNWGDSFSRGPINNRTGRYGYYTWEDGVKLLSKVSGVNQGFYFQDTWRAHKNVTLNLGMRIENEFLPPYTAESGGKKVANPVSFKWGDKIAPRVGATWDVRGDGKWKAYGNYGIIYDVMKLNLARGSFGGEFWISHVYELNDPNVFALGKGTPGALGPEITNYNNRTIPINAKGELDGIDRNLKPFSTHEFSAGLDHQLTNRLVAGMRYNKSRLRNAIEDIGRVDANGDEQYLIGNPGAGQTRDGSLLFGGLTYSDKTPDGKEYLTPAAVRNYDALEFNVRGQAYKNILLNGSYTYSRLYGNYSGLGNSDENGRSNPNNNRGFDGPYYYFDASGSQRNVLGLLGTDRPHTFKFFTSYDLKTRAGSTFFGVNQIAFSGTPLSTVLTYDTAPTYPLGRGNLGRTAFLTQTDLTVSHTMQLSERWKLRLEANAINVMNQAAVTDRNASPARQTLTQGMLPVSQFFKGYDPFSFIALAGSATKVASRPIYNLPTAYQSPREIRLGIRLIF